jgi:hypothetical protein
MAHSKSMQWTASSLINGVNGTSSYAISNSSPINSAVNISEGHMHITVPLELGGIDVEQVLKDLMSVTGVVSRNKKLEAKYKGLKKAGEVYQETLRNAQLDVNIKIKEAADRYRFEEEKYKTLDIIKDSK